MESRVMGNCHARFGAGENLEMTSKGSLLQAYADWDAAQNSGGEFHGAPEGCLRKAFPPCIQNYRFRGAVQFWHGGFG